MSDHPRMRGEDEHLQHAGATPRGSPPHARGRPGRYRAGGGRAGITPACAGKTLSRVTSRTISRDHPRMRGEDPTCRLCCVSMGGSPPHARGRPRPCPNLLRSRRITPACAGKTNEVNVTRAASGDHPRMRGEDLLTVAIAGQTAGSPPHARGRLDFPGDVDVAAGITPACAGKTFAEPLGDGAHEDHPRMRGEDGSSEGLEDGRAGSPPHARGRLFGPVLTYFLPSDHPRMRGEDRFPQEFEVKTSGSPPHARGRPILPCISDQNNRITPACAGKTRTGF